MATGSTSPPSWLTALRRRWSTLLRWFSRAQQSPSRTALPAATRDDLPVTPPAPAPAAAVIAETTASVTAATALTSSASMSASAIARPAPPSAEVIIRAATAASSGVMPAPQTSAPPARVVERASDSMPGLVGGPVMDPGNTGLGQLSVRLFFSKMLAATPEGLTIDFTRWQSASVERFFLAITSPGLIRRREAPTTGDERLTLPTAFEGFEWD
jgi:hypothetical protein